MDTLGYIFGVMGMTFGLMGFIFGMNASTVASSASAKVDRLEKMLNEAGYAVNESEAD